MPKDSNSELLLIMWEQKIIQLICLLLLILLRPSDKNIIRNSKYSSTAWTYLFLLATLPCHSVLACAIDRRLLGGKQADHSMKSSSSCISPIASGLTSVDVTNVARIYANIFPSFVTCRCQSPRLQLGSRHHTLQVPPEMFQGQPQCQGTNPGNLGFWTFFQRESRVCVRKAHEGSDHWLGNLQCQNARCNRDKTYHIFLTRSWPWSVISYNGRCEQGKPTYPFCEHRLFHRSGLNE